MTDSDNASVKLSIRIVESPENPIDSYGLDIVLVGCNCEVCGAAKSFFGIGAVGY